MIAVSNNFKNAMKQPIKELDAYIIGNVTLKSADDLISFKISCDSGMCKSAMRKLEAKYLGEHNLLGQWVHVGYGVKLTDGTFEYLDYGSFLVTEITTVKDTGVTTIIGYDKMVSSMTQYTKLEVEYPISLLDYTKLICNACGLELGNTVFGTNLCFTNVNEWELGHYSQLGYKENYNNSNCRARLKNWTPVAPNSSLYFNCYNEEYVFVIRCYDAEGTFLYSYGIANNNDIVTFTDKVNYIGVSILNKEHGERYNEGNIILEKIANEEIKPFICVSKGTDNQFKPYNDMNGWEITQELWENINGITYRDILVQIAQATGTTCIIGNDDRVYFKPLTETGEQLTYSNMLKLKLEPMYGEINSVVLSRTPQEDNIYMRDEDSVKNNGLTEYKIENNEIIDKDRDNAMTPIYNELHGISYYPFETTTEGLGWYDIADSITIINDTGDLFKTSLFSYSITVDGAIKETLKTVADTKTQTQYQYATTIAKRVKNTEIVVDKQGQSIAQLVSDMYEEDGIVNENFTRIDQDIHNIVNSVQNSGGSNLIKNSVMFAYDDTGVPKDWEVESKCKNICPNEWELGHYAMDTGVKEPYGDQRIRQVDLIKVSPNTEYYFNTNMTEAFVVRAYDINKNFIYSIGGAPNDTTVTTNSITHYISVAIYGKDTPNYGEVILNKINTYDKKPYISLAVDKNYNYTPYTNKLIIDSSTEALNSGSLSGHIFTIENNIVRQKISVKASDINDPNKLYYSFSTKIKKEVTGDCYVKLYNSNEEHIIELKNGESAFFKDFEIKSLLPKDNYYIIEFYGSADSGATFTDSMFSIGEYKSQWQQANGEVMNTQVNINLDGILIKSSVYLGDYTVVSPLEFAGYSKINGVITKVFSLNKDVTKVKKLEAEDELKMVPMKIVPITSGDIQGWAFVPST